MKNITTIVLMMGLSIFALAQQDTTITETTETVEVFQKQTFLEEYDYVFRTQKPEKQLLKIDLTNWSGGLFYVNGELEFEQKLGEQFSLNTEVGFLRDRNGITRRFIDPNTRYTEWHVEVEPRFYYNMKKRMEEDKAVNNLTGSYVGLRAGYAWIPSFSTSNLMTPEHQINDMLQTYTAELTYGVQGRLFKWGYFNMNVGVGAKAREDVITYDAGNITTEMDVDFSLRYDVGIGIALGNTSGDQQAPTCDFLKCFVEEKDMWKIDLSDVILGVNPDFKVYGGDLNVGYERKIGNSPFSVSTELTGGYLSSGPFEDTARFGDFRGAKTVKFGYRVEPRWYFNMNRRIAQGKAANNLSGAYVALSTAGRFMRSSFRESNVIAMEHNYTAAGLIGYQQRIFKNGYIDASIGYGGVRRGFHGQPATTWNLWEGQVEGHFRIGLAF